MGYLSTLIVEPYIITKDPEKIRKFNKLAKLIELEEEPKDSEVKAIFEEIEKKVGMSERCYFLYRLCPEGHLVVETAYEGEVEIEDDLSDMKHYADYLLAEALKYFADKPTLLRFLGEDFEEWGYFIDPNKKTAVSCDIIPAIPGNSKDEIQIIGWNGIETYKKVG